MNTLFAAVRSVHFASTLLLFGEIVFLLAVARLVPAATGSAAADPITRRFVRVARWSLIVSVASGVAWLALAAAVMSGLPLTEALDRRTLSQVLAETEFGSVWMLRLGLAIGLGVLLAAFARGSRLAAGGGVAGGMLAIAAMYVAALAWAGHAAAGVDTEGEIEILADAVHVLAASAWLGALPGFVFLLRRTHAAVEALAPTRRFSQLGVVCVALLAASGTANAWFLVGDVPALIGTTYGRLLLVKIALFGVMLALAIANRWYLTLRLAKGEARAPRLIRRNAIAEIVFGAIIIAIVGVLGVTPPAIHEAPVWPFAHTLSFVRAEQSQWLLLALVAAALTACIFVGVLLAAIRRHRIGQTLGSLLAIAALAAIFVPMLATPAYPTTYASSPIHYTADAIVAGATLYGVNCGGCHGRYRLDGGRVSSQAGSATSDPTDHALRHRDGEHYWWIAHGIPGTPMPAFGSRLSDDDIWNVVEFLNAQVEAEEAMAMADRIKPLRAIVAPDFAFEGSDRPQESLRQLRGQAATLLVLYTLPESLPRLRELAAETRSYAAAGARVIAAPLASTSGATAQLPDDVRNAIATADATVATAYALFARRSAETVEVPAHVEFLIDRDGYLRVRWIGVGDGASKRTAETLDRIAILRRETPLPAAPWEHRHR